MSIQIMTWVYLVILIICAIHEYRCKRDKEPIIVIVAETLFFSVAIPAGVCSLVACCILMFKALSGGFG